LLTGPPRYVARGAWRPLIALVAVVIIQGGLQFAAGVLGTLAISLVTGTAVEALTEQQLLHGILVFLVLSQVAVIAMTWVAARSFGGRAAEVLQTDRGWPTAGDILVALAGLALVLGVFNLLVYLLRPELFMADAAQFLPMLKAPYWPLTALAIGIGAPMSEELLFRGFLISALAKGSVGFWPAALLANAVWTAFHLGYSIIGLLEVFCGGLYLTWLLWRSGSIWLPIICHAATNLVFLLIVAIYLLH
jgi:membrane protease YdiL (CAAX protease family)